jgi:hypothetical protein
MNTELFLKTLPYAAEGMLGVFAVMLALILLCAVLNWFSRRKDRKKDT